MQFITTIKINEGKFGDAIKLFKHPRLLDEIKIQCFLGVFGDCDAVIIFEAPSESAAVEFVSLFQSVAKTQTSLVFPVSEYRLTSHT